MERTPVEPGFSDLPDPVGGSPEKAAKRESSPKPKVDRQAKLPPKDPGFSDLPDPVGKSPVKSGKGDEPSKPQAGKSNPVASPKNFEVKTESRESGKRPSKPTQETKPEKDRPKVDSPDNSKRESKGFNPDDWVIP